MKSYIQNPLALAAKFATFEPMSLVQKIERGDSDTSASTIRTAGAVFLVVIVVGAIITAVSTVGSRISTRVSGVTW
jgi:hypothetical protein